MTSSAFEGAQSFTSRIAMWSARHRKVVALIWVLIVVVALGACSTIEADTSVEEEAPGDSGKAVALLEERFPAEEETTQEIVVFSHPSLQVTDAEYQETVQGLMDALSALRARETEVLGGTRVVSSTRIVAETASHYDTGLTREDSPFVAPNDTGGDVTFALVQVEGEVDEAVDKIDPVLEAVAEADAEAGEFEILIGGGASLTAFDAVQQHGGNPANYCEIGGNPSVFKVQELTKHILSKSQVEKIAVIMNVVSNTRVDMVARGVVKGILEAGKLPSETVAVFRVPGAWEEEGFKILSKYGVPFCDRTVSIDEAAKMAVERMIR